MPHFGDPETARKDRPPLPRCHATAKNSGQQCKQPAIPGGTVCRYHGGGAPQVKAAAARRLLVQGILERAAYFGDLRELDPATALEEELWRTAGHVAWLGHLVGVRMAAQPLDERETYELYQTERKHLFEVSKACLSIGIEERRVRVSEQLAERIASFGRGLLEAVGVDPRSDVARSAFRRQLTLIAGGKAS